MTQQPNLEYFFAPGAPLPADSVMIAKALEILETSPHGQQLVNFVAKKGISIKIVATPGPITYIPEKNLVYLGFNRNTPVSPVRFILMLVGALREAQQEAAGIKYPPFGAPMEEHKKVTLAKYEDQAWYLCTISRELDKQTAFGRLNFSEELRKMGYDEALELHMKQETI